MYQIKKMRADNVIDFAAEELKKYLRIIRLMVFCLMIIFILIMRLIEMIIFTILIIICIFLRKNTI